MRDFNNGYRYLDLAYMPGGVIGGIEIQGYGPHARDLDVRRFKDISGVFYMQIHCDRCYFHINLPGGRITAFRKTSA
ncbi:hypothetical protein D3C85_1735390 [compost metagenome]